VSSTAASRFWTSKDFADTTPDLRLLCRTEEPVLLLHNDATEPSSAHGHAPRPARMPAARRACRFGTPAHGNDAPSGFGGTP
jgi:hypothetical protein